MPEIVEVFVEEYLPCINCGQITTLRYNGRFGGGEGIERHDPWLMEQRRREAEQDLPTVGDYQICADCGHRKLSHMKSQYNCTVEIVRQDDMIICGCLEFDYSLKRKVMYETTPAAL